MDSYTYLFWAFLLGSISAASLPLGSFVGLIGRPNSWVIGFLAAFGAGALLAALSVELIAPTVSALHFETQGYDLSANSPLDDFLALVLGLILGSVAFITLDQIVNAHGGFLRKSATTVAWFSKKRKQRQQAMLRDLSQIELLQAVPKNAIQDLVDRVRPVHFNRDEMLFRQGDVGDSLFFIKDGEVVLYQDGKEFKRLGAGSVLGEMGMVTAAPRAATAKASKGVHCLLIHKSALDHLRSEYPEFDTSLRNFVSVQIDELSLNRQEQEEEEVRWARRASRALKQGSDMPSPRQLRAALEEHNGAPMAIWLGILLDGIPESLVIGTGLAAMLLVHQSAGFTPGFLDVIPYTLMAGLILSNFPEALSSSVGMKSQGMQPRNIFGLWLSLMFMTGVGAAIGYSLSEVFSPAFVTGIQGMAAGAMLTMIAAAMIPEAAHRGGPMASGIGTMLGFILAICFKLLE